MPTKLPFATELEIVRMRLKSTLQETADEFGISKQAVINVMARQANVVEEVKRQMEVAAIRKIVAEEIGEAWVDKPESPKESPKKKPEVPLSLDAGE